MSQDLFIGVDGGGTQSKVRVEDKEGTLLGQAVSGPGNIRLSVELTWHSIYTALNDILNPLHISLENQHYRFHAGMGLAGCELTEAYHHFLECPHPFKTLILTSDAHIACLGAHLGKEGAIIIIGTGVVGYQIQKDEVIKVGGWGFPYDDEGGGAWLGLEAARLTCQWLDHRIEKSPLVEDIFAFFKGDKDYFVKWTSTARSTEFAKLAPFVIHHSQQEEIAAVHLMKKAAHAVDRIGLTLHKRSVHDTPYPCALLGGIAPFLKPWLSAELQNVLVPRLADANVGAILMIRQKVS